MKQGFIAGIAASVHSLRARRGSTCPIDDPLAVLHGGRSFGLRKFALYSREPCNEQRGCK